MPSEKRLSKEEFGQLLAGRDGEELKKVLWELYCRGSAELRRKIEIVAVPREKRPAKAGPPPVDGADHLASVRELVRLARAGAYMGGSRDVSRGERAGWKASFRERLDDSGRLLTQGDVEHGAEAMDALLCLALDCRDTYSFRTEDPIGALRIVVSDLVDLLWRSTLTVSGFPALVARAPRDLMRWESLYGWTRWGNGRIAQKERTLADVLAALLPGHDAWVAMADGWLGVFAGVERERTSRDRLLGRAASSYVPHSLSEFDRWHDLLYQRLRGSEATDRLVRLAAIPSRPTWDLWLLRVRLARDAGRIEQAQRLALDGLKEWPGSQELLAIAREVGAPVPDDSRRVGR